MNMISLLLELDQLGQLLPIDFLRYPTGRCCYWKPAETRVSSRTFPGLFNSFNALKSIGNTKQWNSLNLVLVSTITSGNLLIQQQSNQFVNLVDFVHLLGAIGLEAKSWADRPFSITCCT